MIVLHLRNWMFFHLLLMILHLGSWIWMIVTFFSSKIGQFRWWWCRCSEVRFGQRWWIWCLEVQWKAQCQKGWFRSQSGCLWRCIQRCFHCWRDCQGWCLTNLGTCRFWQWWWALRCCSWAESLCFRKALQVSCRKHQKVHPQVFWLQQTHSQSVWKKNCVGPRCKNQLPSELLFTCSFCLDTCVVIKPVKREVTILWQTKTRFKNIKQT